jgi:hypothetical protein
MDIDLSYQGLSKAINTGKGLYGTIRLFEPGEIRK